MMAEGQSKIDEDHYNGTHEHIIMAIITIR